jgi:hypothetical protein
MGPTAMQVCISIDMDNYREYRSLVDPSGDTDGPSFYLDALPRFLDLLDRCGARATFFMIGRDGEREDHRRAVREIAACGHEVGNHSYSHPYNFRQLDRAAKAREIDRADAIIADIIGARPVGFRTPSCDVDGETLALLAERGYLYDSSVFPSPLMWAFMLYGKLFVRRSDYQLGHLASIFAPPRPYVPSTDRLHRECRPGTTGAAIVEIPVSVVPVVRLPFYSTFLRLLGARGFALCVRAYGRRRSILHTLFHLIELARLEGTTLERSMSRTPGLGVSHDRRQGFVTRAVETLAGLGNAVPMREVAGAVLTRHRLAAEQSAAPGRAETHRRASG